jgi:hypothetical protein
VTEILQPHVLHVVKLGNLVALILAGFFLHNAAALLSPVFQFKARKKSMIDVKE